MSQPEYKKTTYREVAGTFTRCVKSPDVAILGLLPISRKVSMGINDKGVWLWHIPVSDSLTFTMFPDNCPFGFFEWRWIREIHVSFSRRMAFLVMRDLDAVLREVVVADDKEAFAKSFVGSMAGERAIVFPLSDDGHFSVLDSVRTHKYTKVYTIE